MLLVFDIGNTHIKLGLYDGAQLRAFWRIATGGLAEVITAESTVIDIVEPNLTLEGLRLVYELNREGDKQ